MIQCGWCVFYVSRVHHRVLLCAYNIVTYSNYCPLWVAGFVQSPNIDDTACMHHDIQCLVYTEFYTVYLSSILLSSPQSHEVCLFHYKQWLEGGRPDLVSLLKYLMSVEKAKQSAGNHPVVVACEYVCMFMRSICSDLHV